MRPKFIFPGLGLMALLALLLWVGGCSSDKSVTTGITPGVENDPGFLLVQDHINNYLDSVNVTYQMALAKTQPTTEAPWLPDRSKWDDGSLSDPLIGKIHDEVDVYEINYANGWHTINFANYNTYAAYLLCDSIQFQIDQLSLAAAEGADYMRYIRHWSFTSKNTDVTHIDLSGHFDYEFSGLDLDVATINGTDDFMVTWNYISADSTVEAVFAFETTVNDLDINRSTDDFWSCGCPVSGSVNLNLEVSYTKDGGDFPILTTRSWEITADIENGSATITAISGDNYWEYTYDMCVPE
jgi:hypothetical protein